MLEVLSFKAWFIRGQGCDMVGIFADISLAFSMLWDVQLIFVRQTLAFHYLEWPYFRLKQQLSPCKPNQRHAPQILFKIDSMHNERSG